MPLNENQRQHMEKWDAIMDRLHYVALHQAMQSSQPMKMGVGQFAVLVMRTCFRHPEWTRYWLSMHDSIPASIGTRSPAELEEMFELMTLDVVEALAVSMVTPPPEGGV